MKISTHCQPLAVMVIGLCLMSVAKPAAQSAGSFSDLDIEYSELKVTLDKVLGENKLLRSDLAETSKTLADMRKNLASSSGEGEIFKRQAMELKLRMEALGLETAGGNSAKLEQRLLAAVSDLRVMADEKKQLGKWLPTGTGTAYTTSEILAPASANANAAPRAAPPLPTISAVDFASFSFFANGTVTPSASVFVPRHLPAFFQIVLTAPIRRANGSTVSKYRRTFCLCGIVILAPANGSASAI